MFIQGNEGMQQAWKTYVEEGKLDLQIVRADIARSWQRCRTLNLNPHELPSLEIVGDELRERILQKKTLIETATPYMKDIFSFVKGSGFQVVLADEFGFLLNVVGDHDIVLRTKQVQLCPGGNWSESVKGTNAIGTAIVEKNPIQIHAWEHFFDQNHFLTCSAAPIINPDGELVGVLDVSGDFRYANYHTLGMVVSAVKAIQNDLALGESRRKLSKYFNMVDLITDFMSDGFLSVDKEGIIVDLNAAGGDLLGVQPQNALGKKMSEVFINKNPIAHLLETDFDNKLHFSGKGSKNFTSSASLLHDESGTTVGAIAILKHCRKRQDVQMKTFFTRYSFDDIVGESQSIQTAKKMAGVAARSPSTVLILGESGTGKELFAQAVHNGSSRKKGPFLSINCAAIPEALIESELFGHEEGAFTGSKKGGHTGKFEVAAGGTVFLDEIGDMPLFAQVKLLRVIQERKVARIGSSIETPVDIRIIAATHKDLAKEVENGSFRKDLYYRLNVLCIKISTLKERLDDIPMLSEFILKKISWRLGKSNITFHKSFYEACKFYNWPGNIRELENVIEHSANLVEDGGEITSDLIPFESNNQATPFEIKPLKDIEKEAIIKTLNSCKGNIIKTSTRLGVSRNTIYRKIKEYDIDHLSTYDTDG